MVIDPMEENYNPPARLSRASLFLFPKANEHFVTLPHESLWPVLRTGKPAWLREPWGFLECIRTRAGKPAWSKQNPVVLSLYVLQIFEPYFRRLSVLNIININSTTIKI